MTGYWNKPQDTEDCFVGRFFRTGDVGYMDEEGYIFIVDRIKDMINASGFKVYPRRIEDALYEHPAVAEVTVIGIPDAYRGEAPKAFVKLKEGKEATRGGAASTSSRRSSPSSSCPQRSSSATSCRRRMIGKLSKARAPRRGQALIVQPKRLSPAKGRREIKR